ncbi:unnamed protein product [Orchesella dallaii]|uniref:CRAL-TRIO domain-containing protein n=1 Tax=Orchesella dallaii TaxID=48710 RepID=A0ABP1REK4_9HEXA
MAAVTSEEAKVLSEFRKRVSDVLKNKEQNEDIFLIRWMRARDLNLDKAENMLRNSLKWREENNVDKVLEVKFDPFYSHEFPCTVLSQDKIGNPVLAIPLGKWDFREIVSQGKTEEFKLYVSYVFETIMEGMRERNLKRNPDLLPISQVTVVCDWDSFSYMQLVNIKAVQQLLHMASVFDAHYPEILYHCFFLNCPSFFNIFLAMLKPVLAPKTLGKITIHGSNMSEWEPAVHEVIEPDQLHVVLRSLKL